MSKVKIKTKKTKNEVVKEIHFDLPEKLLNKNKQKHGIHNGRKN